MVRPTRSSPASPIAESGEGRPDCVVVGDIHGCLKNLKRVLAQSGVLDEETKSKWVHGNRTVVQVGDMLDRGHEDPAVLAFVQDMMRQAEASGGRWAQVGVWREGGGLGCWGGVCEDRLTSAGEGEGEGEGGGTDAWRAWPAVFGVRCSVFGVRGSKLTARRFSLLHACRPTSRSSATTR